MLGIKSLSAALTCMVVLACCRLHRYLHAHHAVTLQKAFVFKLLAHHCHLKCGATSARVVNHCHICGVQVALYCCLHLICCHHCCVCIAAELFGTNESRTCNWTRDSQNNMIFFHIHKT